LLEFCYYVIYLLSYTSSCTLMQITDVKIQLRKSKGLHFGQSSAKHARRNTQNNCHQLLSDSSRVHQIRFRPGLRPGPRWGSLRRSPRPPSRLGRGNPLPIPHLLDALDAFGISPFDAFVFVPHFQKSHGYAADDGALAVLSVLSNFVLI